MKTRTTPRQARSNTSLDLILDAAEQLMHDKGVVEMSTVEVAAAAGVSVGRLYYWFPDKDAIVSAALRRAEKRLQAFLQEVVVDDPALSADQMLARLVPALAGFFRTHPGSLAVLQRGPTGDGDPGRSLCQLFVELTESLIRSRRPGVDERECHRVANTGVRITIALMNEVLRNPGDEGDRYLDELQFVLGVYLAGHYPDAVGSRRRAKPSGS